MDELRESWGTVREGHSTMPTEDFKYGGANYPITPRILGCSIAVIGFVLVLIAVLFLIQGGYEMTGEFLPAVKIAGGQLIGSLCMAGIVGLVLFSFMISRTEIK